MSQELWITKIRVNKKNLSRFRGCRPMELGMMRRNKKAKKLTQKIQSVRLYLNKIYSDISKDAHLNFREAKINETVFSRRYD